jgi:hypothetical protein
VSQHRIKEEMEKVGFDKVENSIQWGNVLGYIGHGLLANADGRAH